MGYTLEGSVRVENGKTYICSERIREIVGEYDLDGWSDYTKEAYAELSDGQEIAEIIYDKVTDTSRWSVHHECVFKLNGKFYRTHYSEGATEMQDESPYEYDGDWVEVDEVVPKEVTIIKYVSKGRD